MRAEKPALEYTLQLGDETIVAPLGLFHPELLAVTGQKGVVTQRRSAGDPEDPHDDHYLRETGVSCNVFWADHQQTTGGT